MLLPQGMFTISEYDATFIVTPTSRFGHDSDTVLATVEMQVHNDQSEDIDFPFAVLTTDSGEGAEARDSVEPHVINGSRPVEMTDDEIDEEALASVMVERARAAGVTDPAKLEEVRRWAIDVLNRAQRTRVGRTKIRANESRRIILQQRLRILPDAEGRFVFETIAPSPIATLRAGGRVSVVVILPWEDDDVRVQIVEKTEAFEVEQSVIKLREWVAWHWKNDPVFRLVYRYE